MLENCPLPPLILWHSTWTYCLIMTVFPTVFLIHALAQWLTSVARICIVTVLSILQWKIPQNCLHRTLIPQSIGRCFEKTSHGHINLTKLSLTLLNRLLSPNVLTLCCADVSENSPGKTREAQIRNIHSRSPLFLGSPCTWTGPTSYILEQLL